MASQVSLSALSLTVDSPDISFAVKAPPSMEVHNKKIFSLTAANINAASPFFSKPVIKKPVYAFAAFNIGGALMSYMKPVVSPKNNLTANSITSSVPTSTKPVLQVTASINLNAKLFLSNSSPSTSRPIMSVIVPSNLGAYSYSTTSPTIDNRPVLE